MRPHLLKTLIITCAISFIYCTPQTVQAAKKVAFLVGVNKYKKPGFRNLAYAERDVSEMSKQLKSFGFDVTLILGKDATKTKLDTTINKLVAPLSKEDLILVMLTGHGVQRTGGDAYYCPYDANAGDDATLFSLSKLLNTTLAPNVGTKLLLIDACRNDPDPGRGRSGGIQGKRITLPEDTAVMFSCKSGQQSFENDEIKHGVFTYCVLQSLNEGAKNGGEISWLGLLSRVNRKMASADATKYIPKGRRQTPIPAGGVPFTVLARVKIIKPKASSETAPAMKKNPPAKAVVRSQPDLLVVPFTKKQAQAKQTEWAKHLKLKSTTTNSIGMKFNLTPPGEFEMGRVKNSYELASAFKTKKENFADEYPHKVRLTKPYYMGTTEVTQEHWLKVMKTLPWRESDQVKLGNDFPATFVSWEDAIKFIEALNQKEDRVYRLPTEAEWEYACRAGSNTMYCYGDSQETMKTFAWFERNTVFAKEDYAHLVGQKQANNFGLFDVHGNVWEWCADGYNENFYRTSPADNPVELNATTGNRVIRGGSWLNHSRILRSGDRSMTIPQDRSKVIGFRIVLEPQ